MIIDDPVLLELHRTILSIIIPCIVFFVTLLLRYFRHRKISPVKVFIFFWLSDALVIMTPFLMGWYHLWRNYVLLYIGLVIIYLYENYIFFWYKKCVNSLLFLFLSLPIIYIITSVFAFILWVPE